MRTSPEIAAGRPMVAMAAAGASQTWKAMTGSRAARVAAVVVVLASFLLLGLSAARRASVTFDEFAHIPAGVAYWKERAFHLYAHNPPLARLIAALPILNSAKLPPLSPVVRTDPEYRWEYAEDFMIRNLGRLPAGEPDGSAYDQIIIRSRLPVIFLGAALGGLIFVWSRQLFGFGGGLLSLTLYAFCPNMLAHASLATTDLAAAFFSALAMFALYRYGKERTSVNSGLAGAAFGLAVLSKFSALVLFPFAVLLAALPVGKEDRPLSHGSRFGHVLVFAALAWVVFCSGYFFTDMFKPFGELPAYSGAWSALKNVLPGWLPAPVPAAAIFGLDAELARAEQHLGIYYLMGQLSRAGWASYFPIALAVKLPIPVLIIWGAALALAALRIRDGADIAETVCLVLLPFALAAFFIIMKNTNYGIRYLLPCFPFLFVLSGALIKLARRRWVMAALLMLLSWHAVGCLRASPHFLTYFNELAGGPQGGIGILADSNLDWGQQLKELKEFMEEKRIGEIALSYNGPVDPMIYGIRWRPYRIGQTGGWVAVSANHLVGFYPMGGAFGGGAQDFSALLKTKPEAIIANSLYVYRH